MPWSEPKWAMCADCVPWILALGANDPVIGNPFNKQAAYSDSLTL